MEPRTPREVFNYFVSSLNLKSDELYALFASSKEALRPLAKCFSVARVEIRIEIVPNIFDLKGGSADLEIDYSKDAAPVEKSRVIDFDYDLKGKASARFYPVDGHEWTEAEWQDIECLGRLTYITYSRARLMNILKRAPFLDIMTGLMNNAGIMKGAAALFRSGYASQDFTAIFMNMKNFKFINRSLGEREGDNVIRYFARYLYQCIDPERECAARLGGDNFFLLVLRENYEAFLEKMNDCYYTLTREGKPVSIRLEARKAVYHCDPGLDMGGIMQNTGYAFEVARRSRQDLVLFQPEMRERVVHQRWITAVFPEAMARGELVPYYQPKVHLENRRIIGAEALVRWIRDGKPVSPVQFIPYLENDNLITRVDQYMLDAVCRDLRNWIDSGIEPVRVSINYSRRNFLEKTLAEDTLAILEKYRIDGKYIEIEVTETSFYEDFDALVSFTNKMHEKGVAVSMDDFGTGYSSLSMFKNLDFDVVKLDKAFIDKLGNGDSKDEIVVESIASMLTRLHTDIVAEGVETEDQLDRVRDLHCQIIQGYFFDKPLPHKEFQERLKKRVYA